MYVTNVFSQSKKGRNLLIITNRKQEVLMYFHYLLAFTLSIKNDYCMAVSICPCLYCIVRLASIK